MAGQIEAAKRALWNLLKSRKEGLSAKLTITTANGSLKVTLEQSFPPHHSNVDSSKLKKSKKVKKSKRAGASHLRRKERRLVDPLVQQRAARHRARETTSEASSAQGEAMSSPEKVRDCAALIPPLGTSPVKDEGREEMEEALVEAEVEKSPRLKWEVPADYADRANNEDWDGEADYAKAREAEKLMSDTDMCLFCDYICPPPTQEENEARISGWLQSLCDHIEQAHPLAFEWLG